MHVNPPFKKQEVNRTRTQVAAFLFVRTKYFVCVFCGEETHFRIPGCKIKKYSVFELWELRGG
jgi:hypothetical protein